jgi:hypothetical protein
MPGRYGKGCAPDDDHKKTQRDARVLCGMGTLTAAQSDSTSMRSREPACFNQLGCEGCTGHASSSADYIVCPDLGVVSPRWNYTIGREVGAPSQPLQDNGAQIADVCKGHADWGVIPIGPLNPGGNTDVTPANVNQPGGLGGLEVAAQKRIVGDYRVALTAPDAIIVVRQLLAQGVPLLVGGFVDSAFESYALGQPAVDAPNQSDPSGGGHAMVIVGYRTQPDGSTWFEVLSSWGAGFGDAGHAWVTEAWVLALWDCYAWTVREATS